MEKEQLTAREIADRIRERLDESMSRCVLRQGGGMARRRLQQS